MKLITTQQSFTKVTAPLCLVGVHQSTVQEEMSQLVKEELQVDLITLLKRNHLLTQTKFMQSIPLFQEHAIEELLTVGLGDKSDYSAETVRQIFAKVGKKIVSEKKSKVAIHLPSFTYGQFSEEEVANLAIEGILLGHYQVEHYKFSSNEEQVVMESIEWLTTEDEIDATLGQVKAEAVNHARKLVNMPPNLLTATHLAEDALALAKQYGFEIEVLGKEELEEIGAGAILAVNQGSVEPPRLIVMKYQGQEEWTDVVGLVGKGITFDTGGYTLKINGGMIGMKVDMGGAAAVLGAMKIIGERRPKKNVIAVIAATDNMISGNAIRPDDVITSLSGQTIEIVSTDAEGRLVLADAMTYAIQEGADQLIDIATLTGGVIVALGNDKTGALTNNEEFFEEFMDSALAEDEFVWRLPLTKGDIKRLRTSQVADLNNSPGRDGHMIFGGGFVGEFADGKPWIHLDIAGTGSASNEGDLGPKGGTGVMVRTLAHYITKE